MLSVESHGEFQYRQTLWNWEDRKKKKFNFCFIFSDDGEKERERESCTIEFRRPTTIVHRKNLACNEPMCGFLSLSLIKWDMEWRRRRTRQQSESKTRPKSWTWVTMRTHHQRLLRYSLTNRQQNVATIFEKYFFQYFDPVRVTHSDDIVIKRRLEWIELCNISLWSNEI